MSLSTTFTSKFIITVIIQLRHRSCASWYHWNKSIWKHKGIKLQFHLSMTVKSTEPGKSCQIEYDIRNNSNMAKWNARKKLILYGAPLTSRSKRLSKTERKKEEGESEEGESAVAPSTSNHCWQHTDPPASHSLTPVTRHLPDICTSHQPHLLEGKSEICA